MKIAVDFRYTPEKNAGIGVYTHNLIRNLSLFDRKNEYFLFSNDSFNYSIEASNFNERMIRLPLGILWRRTKLPLWDLVRLPVELKKDKIDVFHNTGMCAPVFCKCKKIVTLHDITFMTFAQNLTEDGKRYWNTWVLKSVKESNRIITVSESSKHNITELLKIEKEKISVIYNGINDEFKPIKNKPVIQQIYSKYKLPCEFILFVGTLEPRKNIPNLLRAFYKLNKNRRIKHKLVIIGKKGWKYEEIFNTVKLLNLEDEVVFFGFIPQEELPLFYNSANLLVYPSLYEGFGLPPLEAMACGTPVITSNTSSLPEVVGDAGIMVDPYDIDGLARAIYEVLTNNGLRDDMIKKGLERAKLFGWEKTARETLKIYEEVYDEQ